MEKKTFFLLFRYFLQGVDHSLYFYSKTTFSSMLKLLLKLNIFNEFIEEKDKLRLFWDNMSLHKKNLSISTKATGILKLLIASFDNCLQLISKSFHHIIKSRLSQFSRSDFK